MRGVGVSAGAGAGDGVGVGWFSGHRGAWRFGGTPSHGDPASAREKSGRRPRRTWYVRASDAMRERDGKLGRDALRIAASSARTVGSSSTATAATSFTAPSSVRPAAARQRPSSINASFRPAGHSGRAERANVSAAAS
jgi:hypothetical protein